MLYAQRKDLTPEQRTAALGDLEEAIAREPKDSPQKADDHVTRARLLFDAARHEEALASCDTALRLVRDYPEAHRLRIETLVILKRYDQVLSSCDAYLAREKPTAEVLGIRSLALLERKDYAGAIADLTRAIALRPAPEPVILTRLLNRRGLAYHLADAPRLARDDFESSLQLDKDQSDALAGRGLARISLGQWRPAVADAEAAVGLLRALPTPDQDPNVLAQTFINAALIYAQAVEHAAREVRREGERAVTLYRRYHSRSLELLQSGLQIGIVPNYPIGRLTVRAALRGPPCLLTRSVSEGLFPFCRKDLRQSSLTLRVSVERNRRCQGRDAVNPRPWDDANRSQIPRAARRF